jgi:hypothetical protein
MEEQKLPDLINRLEIIIDRLEKQGTKPSILHIF